jgi:hypothetical protein
MKFKVGDHIIRTVTNMGSVKVTKGHIINIKNGKYVIVWRGSYKQNRIPFGLIDFVCELDPVEMRNVKLENILR